MKPCADLRSEKRVADEREEQHYQRMSRGVFHIGIRAAAWKTPKCNLQARIQAENSCDQRSRHKVARAGERAGPHWQGADQTFAGRYPTRSRAKQYRLRTVMGDAWEAFTDPRRFFYRLPSAKG